ncbi:MAG: DUF6252 family protein [Candidatus Stygibacter frigidus]|nr:DUF6252 family protein [Candidatus Stygibacter frigidus]
MSKILKIIFILLVILLLSCDKDDKITNPFDVHDEGYFSAKVNGVNFYTNDVDMPIFWGNSIMIFGMKTEAEIGLSVEPKIGTYIVKENCTAGYYDKITTTHFYWATEGQITVSEANDNQNISGNFNFIVNIEGNIFNITDGVFSVYKVEN